MATYREIDRTLSSPWRGSDVIRSLTDRCGAFLFLYSITHKTLVSWSENIQEVLGDSEVSLGRQGNLFLHHVHPDDRFRLLPRLERALEGAIEYRETYRWARPDTKQLRWLHCRAHRVERDGEVFFEGVILDLSDEIGGGTIVSSGAASPESALTALPYPVISVDRDFHILRLNRDTIDCTFGDALFKKEKVRRGESLLNCFGSVDRRALLEEVGRRILMGEIPHHRMNIEEVDRAYTLEIHPLRDDGVITGLLFIVTDGTEVRHLKKMLQRSEREKGLGVLAAGLAHNFNNALQSIMGHTAFIRSHSDESGRVLEATNAIMGLVAETSELTRQLFAFEPIRDDVVVPVDLNVAVMSAVNRIQDLFSSGRRVAVAFGSLVKVYGREEVLAQGLEGVIRFMRTATPEQGLLTIKTYQRQVGQGEIPALSAGRYGKLLISNLDGTSANNSLPFLNLTTGIENPTVGPEMNHACAAIRKIGGTVLLSRAPCGDTSIELFLPSEDVASLRSERLIQPQHSVIPQILLIDDDPIVLSTVQAILRDLGYEVVTAGTREDALETLRVHGNSLKLAFVDGIMPGADGASLIREFRGGYPHLQCLGFSGAGPRVEQDLLDAGAVAVLSKPVAPQVLGDVVQKFMPVGAANKKHSVHAI